jgi:hypothetical protein
MLKRIVMQVSGQVMAQFTTAYIQLTTCLLRTAKHLLALITQAYHSARAQLLLLVKTVLSFKVWPAKKTIAEPLIKAELTTAKAKVMDLGKQRVTTARRTRRHAKHQPKKGK